jgi:mono/diheme cytochrome c family protein
MSKRPSPEGTPREDQETLFSLRTVALGMLVLVIAIGVVQVVSFGVTQLAQRPLQSFPTITPPEPRLQANPPQELQVMKATQAAQISEYAWVDRQAGVVRIPIERAMALYAQSLQGGGTPAPIGTLGPQGAAGPAQAGQALFQELGCMGCHTGQPNAVGPPLAGLIGEQVTLSDGQTITADEAYIRESILDPSARVVAGYQPIMPSFQGRISEEELTALVDYIRSLEAQ